MASFDRGGDGGQVSVSRGAKCCYGLRPPFLPTLRGPCVIGSGFRKGSGTSAENTNFWKVAPL